MVRFMTSKTTLTPMMLHVYIYSVNYKRRVSTDDPPPYTLAASEPVISGYQSILYLEQLASNNKSSVRRITQRIVSSRAFEVAIFSFILVSAICLVSCVVMKQMAFCHCVRSNHSSFVITVHTLM